MIGLPTYFKNRRDLKKRHRDNIAENIKYKKNARLKDDLEQLQNFKKSKKKSYFYSSPSYPSYSFNKNLRKTKIKEIKNDHFAIKI